jgi:hypothetical protein
VDLYRINAAIYTKNRKNLNLNILFSNQTLKENLELNRVQPKPAAVEEKEDEKKQPAEAPPAAEIAKPVDPDPIPALSDSATIEKA